MNELNFLQTVLSELNIAVLQRIGYREYKFLGKIPEFYSNLYPSENGNPCQEPWRYSDMIEFFIEDAEMFFARGDEGMYSSEIWQEEGIEGNKALLAHAINSKGYQCFIVRCLSEEYMERVRILRKARENLLEHRALSSDLKRYKKISRYDSLTNIYNKATFMDIHQQETVEAAHTGSPLALLMLDIDNFKQVNDTYGHIAGDAVLASIGSILNSHLRGSDIAARYGGEEFVVLAPFTTREQVCKMAENLRKRVESFDFVNPPHITVSIGCTIYQPGESLEEFIGRADAGLYDAKRDNKNNIKIR